MLKQGFGHIVNTASSAGLFPTPFQSLYNATKYAVVELSESLRYEYAEKGLNFSVICHSNIATPIFSKVIDSKGRGLKTPDAPILLTKQPPTFWTGLQNARQLSSCLKIRIPIFGKDKSSETRK
jgi:short-subunit dehydrogenase